MVDFIWLIISFFGIFLDAIAKIGPLASTDSVLRQVFVGS